MSEQQTDWRQVKVGDFLAEHSERSISSNQHEVLSVTKDGIFSQREYFKKQIASEDNSGYKVVRRGDVVFSTMNLWMGSIDVVKDQEIGIVSPAYITMRPTNELIDTGFLGYFLRGEEMRRKYVRHSQQGASIVRRNLNKDDLLDDEVFIPPLPEQKKIAEILSGIDKAISIKGQARNALTAIREAICSELIQNGDWPQEEIGDLASHMTNGFVGTATPHYRERGVKYLTSKNIRRDRIDPKRMIYISEEFHMANRKSSLMVGDVLMVQSGHIGTTAVVTNDYKDCNCHALILMRFNQERLDPEYASLYFNSATGKTRLSDIFVGSTVKHVNTGDLRKFKIPVPPLGVQRDIAKRISTIDLLLGKRELQIEKLVILKQAISSDLLSGRKRVSI